MYGGEGSTGLMTEEERREEADLQGEEAGAEEEEEEDDDDEEDGGGEYRLRFEGEMDPLDYVDVDAAGIEPYQKFERLEYEALAEKKRKAAALLQRDEHAKVSRQGDDVFGAEFDEIMESMTRRRRRRSGKRKKSGRRKGSKNKHNPEITKKLGEATLHYASGRYDEAIHLLKEVVRIAPNLAEAHHTLGLIYDATGDRKKAMNFYMIAAHLTPKDPSLWKLLVAWSIEEGNTGQFKYCLSKAITADPKDIGLRLNRALLFIELGDYAKAAESYDQVIALCPSNIEVRKMAAKIHQKCGQIEKGISILKNYLCEHSSDAYDTSVAILLMSLHMENKSYINALEVFDRADSACTSGKGLPLPLIVKAGICHAYLGNTEKSEVLLQSLQQNALENNVDLILEVAGSFSSMGDYNSALKYYSMLDGTIHDNASLQLKISECYLSLKERRKAVPFLYKALSMMEDNIDARISLAVILLQEEKFDDAIALLSPPKDSKSASDAVAKDNKVPWWCDGRIKMHLAGIYYQKGMLEEFVDVIFLLVRETLSIESMKEKVPIKKRLTKSVLNERSKLLDYQADNVFCGFTPIATPNELVKASRAKKNLLKRAAKREERKAKAVASGLQWQSDDSEEEIIVKEQKKPPLPKLLKDEEDFCLILDLCKALVRLQRNGDALEVINLVQRFSCNTITLERKEELQSIGVQIAYNAADPNVGYDSVRSIVRQHPHSYAAWNCYYKVISRLDYQLSRHLKFLRKMRSNPEKCVSPIIIYGHQFTMNSQHQDAAREYLQAVKLQPDNPLTNLCAGTALINLALGFRLKNKHVAVIQGLGFIYKYLQICDNSQEALYNVARACHHVGLFTLAVSYYEKVLAIDEKDYPIPRLPNEVSCSPEIKKPGYCNLHREAAYNLHLIYKRSGAVDLARQILKVYCVT